MKKLYYAILVLGIAIIAFGIGIVGKITIEAFASFSAEEHKFLAPGEIELYLDEEGIYSVFFEYISYFDDKEYATGRDLINNLVFEVTDIQRDSNIQVEDIREVNFKGSYSIHGQNDIEAQEEFRFVLEKPAHIVIDTSSSEVTDKLVLCVKKNDAIASLYQLKSKARMLILSQIIGVVLIVFSIVMIIKSHSKKRILK